MAREHTVAKNTLFLTAGSICQKLLAFVYFTGRCNGGTGEGDMTLCFGVQLRNSVVRGRSFGADDWLRKIISKYGLPFYNAIARRSKEGYLKGHVPFIRSFDVQVMIRLDMHWEE